MSHKKFTCTAMPSHPLAVSFLSSVVFLVLSLASAHAAQVKIEWKSPDLTPDGYRIYIRESDQSYDYSDPAWEGGETACIIPGLDDTKQQHFVIRSYVCTMESADSQETVIFKDSDGDKVPDKKDAFPDDPSESVDTDGDGTGNVRDTDDDNDGMPDAWETAHEGLNPLVNDAGGDRDGDGISNLDEYIASEGSGGNPAPPSLGYPSGESGVSLAPVLRCGGYFDPDNDAHAESRWQITRDSDFATPDLDVTTTGSQLIAFQVQELLLNADTTYRWRVRFMDERNGKSEWSQTGSFTTLETSRSEDKDEDGIQDSQENDSLDMDNDGTSDALQDDILSVNTVQGETAIGVKSKSASVSVASVVSLEYEKNDYSNADNIKMPSGLIGFKLILDSGTTLATVTIHLSEPAPAGAKWYKIHSDGTCRTYNNVAFSPDRMSLDITLEDGGEGDDDGVVNGIVLDPSGLGVPADGTSGTVSGSTTGDVDIDGNASASCFISVSGRRTQTVPVGLLLMAGLLCLTVPRFNARSKRKYAKETTP